VSINWANSHGIMFRYEEWFRLWWRSALVTQVFQCKTRLFKAMFGYGQKKMEKTFQKCLKLEFYGGKVPCTRASCCPRNLTFGYLLLQRNVDMLTAMSFFNPCLKFSMKVKWNGLPIHVSEYKHRCYSTFTIGNGTWGTRWELNENILSTLELTHAAPTFTEKGMMGACIMWMPWLIGLFKT
jgi:hypothetical protein